MNERTNVLQSSTDITSAGEVQPSGSSLNGMQTDNNPPIMMLGISGQQGEEDDGKGSDVPMETPLSLPITPDMEMDTRDGSLGCDRGNE